MLDTKDGRAEDNSCGSPDSLLQSSARPINPDPQIEIFVDRIRNGSNTHTLSSLLQAYKNACYVGDCDLIQKAMNDIYRIGIKQQYAMIGKKP